ncbi:MAG: hypothetical protein AB2A00_06680 [Myxococcota bacterium]
MELVKTTSHEELPEVSIDGYWPPESAPARPSLASLLDHLPRPRTQAPAAAPRLRPAVDLLADWLVTYGSGMDPTPMSGSMVERYLKETRPATQTSRGEGPFASLLRSARAEVV